MNKKEFVILCLKLMGIYFFVLGLSAISSLLSVMLQTPDSGSYYSLGPLMYVFAGIVLFVFARRIAAFIIEFSAADDHNIQIVADEQTARVALMTLGIFIFAQALPQLMQLSLDVVWYYVEIDDIPKHLQEPQHRWRILIAPAIRLIIAIALVAGPDKIIALVARYDATINRLRSSHKKAD